MTRRLRIVIASAVVLVGLLLIVVLSFIGVTHTGFGQERVRRMVGTMLEGRVKGKVYIGHMSGGFFNGVTIDSVEIRDDEDSVFFASGPIRVEYDPRDLFDRRTQRERGSHRKQMHATEVDAGPQEDRHQERRARRCIPSSPASAAARGLSIRDHHRALLLLRLIEARPLAPPSAGVRPAGLAQAPTGSPAPHRRPIRRRHRLL